MDSGRRDATLGTYYSTDFPFAIDDKSILIWSRSIKLIMLTQKRIRRVPFKKNIPIISSLTVNYQFNSTPNASRRINSSRSKVRSTTWQFWMSLYVQRYRVRSVHGARYKAPNYTLRSTHTHAHTRRLPNALRRWLPWGTDRRKVGELSSILRQETGALLAPPVSVFPFPFVARAHVEPRLAEIHLGFGCRPREKLKLSSDLASSEFNSKIYIKEHLQGDKLGPLIFTLSWPCFTLFPSFLDKPDMPISF